MAWGILVLAGLFAAVCLWSAWRSLNWTLAGAEPEAPGQGG